MVFRLHRKVCAVFGGSRGIGKAISELLAVRGGNVAVISRYQDHTNECVDHLQALTSREQHLGLSCDVSSFTSVQNTVSKSNKLSDNSVYLSTLPGLISTAYF